MNLGPLKVYMSLNGNVQYFCPSISDDCLVILYFHTEMPQTLLYFHTEMPQTLLYFHTEMPQTLLYFHTEMPQTLLYFHTEMPQTLLHYRDFRPRPCCFCQSVFVGDILSCT